MNWRCLILLAAIPSAVAGDVEDALARGRAARTDGVPQAAIYDLKRSAGEATGRQAVSVIVELARCLIESGREAEAIDWMRKTIYRDDPEVIFWRAQARAQKGDYAAAFEDYRRAAHADAALREEANFGSGRMLEALGRSPEALGVYLAIPTGSARHSAAQLASATIFIESGRPDEAKRLLDAVRPGSRKDKDLRSYLLGRVALDTGKSGNAARIYDDFDPRDRRLAAGLAIGEAEALSRGGDNEKAESRIESFVRENPGSPLIGELLAKLDEVRSREKEPSNATLKQWENDDRNPALAAAAGYYLARHDERQGRTDRAIRNYGGFIKQYPQQPLRIAATIRLARLLVASGQTASATALVTSSGEPADRADGAKLRFLRGATEYQARDYSAASKTFVAAANLDPGIAEEALANAALSAIVAGNEPLAAEIFSALRKQSAGTARRIELAQAFQNARFGNPDAGEQLAWLADHGGVVGDRARLALAEWRWQRGDLAGARSEYRRVSNSAAAGNDDQRDYFAVYLADDGSTKAVDGVARAAEDFIAHHPDSEHEAEVRMKWGEVLMRGGDYRGARFQFEEAGRSTSDPALRQSALFLAARAAAGSMVPEQIEEAISPLLEDVAQEKSGVLAEQARWEQAILQSARGRPKDSVETLDSLIATTKDARLRLAARLKKGDALLALSHAQPERLQDAIKEWRAIAGSPDALPSERNEALTHAAAASEQAGDVDGALSAYYEVLVAPRDRQPEYFWYYKAGFAAAQLLINRERLKEAAAIYEKMAAVPGPRAGEAKERVKHLRLENFIWED
ncbi:MAG: hypothetical protein PHC88_02470 [Terrimicrobiaceae bacterium]|nr:hypothetical protein [Terrimicrobiaceae bacterium]